MASPRGGLGPLGTTINIKGPSKNYSIDPR